MGVSGLGAIGESETTEDRQAFEAYQHAKEICFNRALDLFHRIEKPLVKSIIRILPLIY